MITPQANFMNRREEIQKALLSRSVGEVKFDPISCALYSVDASIFEVKPLGVVIPRSLEELVNLVNIAREYQVPLIPRGAATGITGGCLGRGIIVDFSVGFNSLLEIDIPNRRVICQPGLIQDHLNKALEPYGYRLGPDTSTGNRATIGGMVANNAAGSRSLRFGMMADHLQAVALLLSTGKLIEFGPLTLEEWRQKRTLQGIEGYLYSEAWRLKEEYSQEIQTHFPPIPRRVSGYRLDSLLETHAFNFSKLIAGSEGTLGILTQISLNIVPKIQHQGLCLIAFDDLNQAFEAVMPILSYSPLALEMIDDQIIRLGRESPSLRGKLDWLVGEPKALLIVEFDGANKDEVLEKVQRLQNTSIGQSRRLILDANDIKNVWTLRKSGLGILLSKRTYSRAVAFIEDLSIPPAQLAPFMKEFCALLKQNNKQAGIYGHAGAGCMHIRPYMDLREQSEIDLMRVMMQRVAELILHYGGALSGEHGDGLIRSWLNPVLYGETIMQAFRELKQAFDPYGLMNPGKIIPISDTLEHLRFDVSSNRAPFKTIQDFSAEGGFELAVDLCNGNGLCRKQEGVMCPSFQVTGEEKDSTRGRAQALRQIIHGQLPAETMTSQSLYEVMDLCISCKGCKTECPSQVDMAKMKSEFLFHYQEAHGYSLRTRLFGSIGKLNRALFPLKWIYNGLIQLKLFKMLQSLFGISPFRKLPKLAPEKFTTWLNSYRQPENMHSTLILFPDTFTEFHEPQVGQAAVRLFNRIGYRVIGIPWSCCQRPAISKGMLLEAKQGLTGLIEQLLPYLKKGIPLVGLEPSCISTLRDDLNGFTENGKEYSHLIYTFDEFLADAMSKNTITPTLKKNLSPPVECYVHGHCHQKSLTGMKPTETVLKAISGLHYHLIESGCCGMAGSFGYEKEHYAISMQMGEHRLFPAIRNIPKEAIIVANGFSCRNQIQDGTSRRAVHLAEFIEHWTTGHE